MTQIPTPAEIAEFKAVAQGFMDAVDHEYNHQEGTWRPYRKIMAEMKETYKMNGYEFLGNGCARVVFRSLKYPHLAFKLGRGYNTTSSNKKEYEVFQAATPEQRKLLAEVFHISECNEVLIMEYVDGLPSYIYLQNKYGDSKGAKRMRALTMRFVKKFKQHDFHGNNLFYSKKKRRFIAVDYADD